MTTLPSKSLEFIEKLASDYPKFSFVEGSKDSWSTQNNTITYSLQGAKRLQYSLLHELAHALLDHQSYGSDFELLTFERRAWELASKLGKNYEVTIHKDYIEDCLDSYRDWLHNRSSCPSCNVRTLQVSETSYRCYNCQTKWSIKPKSHFVRAYRRAV